MGVSEFCPPNITPNCCATWLFWSHKIPEQRCDETSERGGPPPSRCREAQSVPVNQGLLPTPSNGTASHNHGKRVRQGGATAIPTIHRLLNVCTTTALQDYCALTCAG